MPVTKAYLKLKSFYVNKYFQYLQERVEDVY